MVEGSLPFYMPNQGGVASKDEKYYYLLKSREGLTDFERKEVSAFPHYFRCGSFVPEPKE